MLEDLLIKQRSPILQQWVDLTLATYPEETRRFYSSQSNEFANPVGSSISQGLAELYDGLLSDPDSATQRFYTFLDKIVRIRAVQNFSPSHAVGFIFLLKKAVRDVMGKEMSEKAIAEELLTFESRIDGLVLLAFNIYMQCRETLFDIRATELRNRTSRILERACQKYGMPHEWEDSVDTDNNSATKPR